MNIQEQESGLTSLLLESISVMKQNRISNKDTRLFESNFKALYKDVNGLSSLNESRIPFTKDENKPNVVLNNPTNVFAYLRKVVDICESYDETFVMNLNESFKVEDSEVKDKYDIPSYIKYLKRVINTLRKQDDFSKLNNQILSIKTSLNQPLRVYGMNVINTHPDDSIYGIIYDKSQKKLIFVSEKDITVYNIEDDSYSTLVESYPDLINDADYSQAVEKITPHNFSRIIKDYVHNNMCTLYTDVRKLDLKYTDNMYKDQEQRSRLADIQKAAELRSRYQQLNDLGFMI